LSSLLNITSQSIQVDCKNFVNILRGANIATKGKQDQRLSVAVSGGIIRVYSIGFDASMVLDTNIEGDKEEMSFNSSFLYSLCSLFRDERIILQFGKQVLKITNEEGNKTAFLATLK
jgi:DNA polymerase III sliding clamp (beta) subunit (PCNA family)